MATIRGNAPVHVFINDLPVCVENVRLGAGRADAWQWCRYCGGDLSVLDADMCCSACVRVYLPTAWQVRTIYGFSRNLGKRERFQKMQQITDV